MSNLQQCAYRKPKYISPSAYDLYLKNREDYYMQYLSEMKIPRSPQLQVMSIGSAFDAYVKSFLYEKLFGAKHDSRFEFQTLFDAQVEQQNRDWALVNGEYVFEKYKSSGALNLLLLDLQKSTTEPKFEIEVTGVVNNDKVSKSINVKDLILSGKPDVFYRNAEAIAVILDFKVNGYLSNYKMSPAKGYIKLLSSTGYDEGRHKDAFILNHKGTMINAAHPIEAVDLKWANQLIIYSWLIGVGIGEDVIIAVDQVLCLPQAMAKPLIKVAQHRVRTKTDYQLQLFDNLQNLWNIIHSEPFHYYHELPIEESQKKCQLLERQVKDLAGLGTEKDRWFSQMSRD